MHHKIISIQVGDIFKDMQFFYIEIDIDWNMKTICSIYSEDDENRVKITLFH